MSSEKGLCGAPWPGGLRWGILRQCDRLRTPYSPHTGKHMNRAERIEWWGAAATQDELDLAERIRRHEDLGHLPVVLEGDPVDG